MFRLYSSILIISCFFISLHIANQEGADQGGETEGNLLVECCNYIGNDEEDCSTTGGNPLIFPTTACDFLGVAMGKPCIYCIRTKCSHESPCNLTCQIYHFLLIYLAMPTCWDETKGIGTNDPFGHVAYTTDGTVGGPCPAGYNKRVPQVQLFVRIGNYKGGTYELSDGSDVFHVDFMNGWKEGKLDEIIIGCEPTGDPGYNPPCDCDQFLTVNEAVSGAVCDTDVKEYILNEETNVVGSLPRGTCQGSNSLIPKSWDIDPPFLCSNDPPPDDEFCADSNLEFKVNRRIGFKNCDWVADQPARRCEFSGIKQHCPETCDAEEYCDVDSPKSFILEENGRTRRCAWTARDSEQRCLKIDMCNTCRETCADFDRCSSF